ncbi:NTTRR-F1 domain [Brevibacillus migulae]|uniref:NTTRR-F1 domain n=1 Tax=Brevibacillus migulae TaxID=1644114 RepID=UPI0014322529|nr:NTTRR-F1 domain [Brevibacillus migulae]
MSGLSRNYIENGDFTSGSLAPWLLQGAALTQIEARPCKQAAVLSGGKTNAYLAQSVAIPSATEFELELNLAQARRRASNQTLVSISIAYYTKEYSFLEYGLIINLAPERLPDGQRESWLHIKERVKPSPPAAARAILLINKLPGSSCEDIFVNQIRLRKISPVTEPRVTAFVANSFSDHLSVIEVDSMDVVDHIDVGYDPMGVVVSPDGRLVFVSNFSGHTVSVIDTGSHQVVNTIQVGQGPSEIVITPNGRIAYVANLHSSTISVMDMQMYRVLETVSLHADSMVISPDGHHLYVAQRTQDALFVMNTSTHETVGQIAVKAPHGIAITPDGNRLYVTNSGANQTVTVIDPSTFGIIEMIKVGNTPTGIIMSPDGSRAYVAVSGDAAIAVLQLPSHTLEATISMDSTPEKLAISPDGKQLFITEMISNQVSILDTDSLHVKRTITLWHGPDGIAVGTVYGAR